MKRKIGSLNPEKPSMAFVGGTLKLFAVHPGACYAYAASRIMVGAEMVTQSPGLEAQFTNHQWETRDQRHAIAMIEDETNFERSWGYYVEPECIPGPALQELFEALGTDGKYVICFRLAEGKATVDEIVNELKAKSLLGEDGSAPEIAADEPAETKPIKLSCPVCALSIDGAMVPNAQAAMRNHVWSVHPDRKGDEAGATA